MAGRVSSRALQVTDLDAGAGHLGGQLAKDGKDDRGQGADQTTRQRPQGTDHGCFGRRWWRIRRTIAGSRYRANAQGEPSALLTPHPLYLALDVDPAGRQAAYR